METNKVKKINLLAFAAHPDDVEISASGIMLKHKLAGYTTGIIDLTAGELGSRGTAETRTEESKRASEILNLDVRENINLRDGFFEINEESLIKIIRTIRRYQPDTILINSETDRHPDHGRAHDLLKRACFLSGLIKIITIDNGIEQAVWRPKTTFSYIQDYFLQPDLIIDVTDVWEQRMSSLLSYSTQFYDPNSKEPSTPISTPEFLDNISGRAIQLGRLINVRYAEGLRTLKPTGVANLMDLY